MARIARWIFILLAMALGLIGAFHAWMYFELYWKYGELFEDGRYYDPVTGVVYHEENSATIFIAAVFFLGAFVLLLRVRKSGKRTPRPPAASDS